MIVMERKGLKIFLLSIVSTLVIILVVAGIMYKNYQEEQKILKEQEKKESALLQMWDIADDFVETLDNRQYEEHINMHSKEGIEYFDGIESMYQFLDRYDFGDSGESNYDDISFRVVELYDDDLERNLHRFDYEEFINEGVSMLVEFGNAEIKYRQKWTFEFIIEDGKMKIDGGVWLSGNVLWEVEEE